jgi:hypothetical protein
MIPMLDILLVGKLHSMFDDIIQNLEKWSQDQDLIKKANERRGSVWEKYNAIILLQNLKYDGNKPSYSKLRKSLGRSEW